LAFLNAASFAGHFAERFNPWADATAAPRSTLLSDVMIPSRPDQGPLGSNFITPPFSRSERPVRVLQVGDMYDLWIGLKRYFQVENWPSGRTRSGWDSRGWKRSAGRPSRPEDGS
jgi:hypothetical protein